MNDLRTANMALDVQTIGLKPAVLPSAVFINGFTPPDYLLDRILQRGFCYSLTGATGAGKTAVALLIAASAALGRSLGEYEVTKGRVLYLAGENSDDIRMRWISMADAMEFDANRISVFFVDGVVRLTDAVPAIRKQVESIGPIDLCIVDTSAAYFEGNEENSNVELGKHARLLRSLTTLEGRPTVLVNCHPVKNATADNLLPRGGGAFIAEVDGNLTCTRKDEVVELHWQGKYRGPDFAPISFKLQPTKTERLVDSKGRQIPSVVAVTLSSDEAAALAVTARKDEDVLLITMKANDGASLAHLAAAAEWFQNDGKPYKTRVNRAIQNLKREGFVKVERGVWHLTDKGHTEAVSVAKR